MAVRIRLLVVGTTLLLAGGCFYKFNNPVSTQANGSIAGQLVLVQAAPGQTLAEASVTLLFSQLTIDLSGSSGKFLFLSLPAGTFTLRYDIPAIAGNDFPLIAFRHDLYIPPSGDGYGDSIDLGNVAITPSGRVSGSLGGGSEPVVVAAFTPAQPDGGGEAYEGFTATTDSAGHYSLLLPAGTHLLASSTTSAAGGQLITVHAGENITQDLALAPPQTPDCAVTLALVFGGFGVNAPTANMENIHGAVHVDVTAEDGSAPPQPYNLASQVPDVGMSFDQALSPGHTYKLTFTLPVIAAPGGGTYPPLVISGVPSIAGKVARLGQVAWLRDSDLCANGVGANCGAVDGGDAGPAWQLLNAAAPQDAGAIEELVPLPIGDGDGGTKGHRLAWVQADGLVYTADDVASGGTTYGPTAQIWSSGPDPVFSISGASTAAGGAAFGWVERNLSQATVAYYPPGAGSETPTISSFSLPIPPSNALASLALVAGKDSTGADGLWVLILEDSGTGGLLEFWFTSDFVNYTRATPIVPPGADAGSNDAGPIDAGPVTATLNAGQVVGAPCSLPELDGGTGVCIAATVNWLFDAGNWTYCAVLDTQPATPTLSVQLIVDAGHAETFGGPAMTVGPLTGGPSSVAAGWTHADALGTSVYEVSQFTTLSTTPTAVPLASPYGTMDNDGALLQWMGAPLAVATFGTRGVGSISLGAATPPPLLPGFGVMKLLHGYNDTNGDVFIAAYDRASSDLTTKLGLFVWPPQP